MAAKARKGSACPVANGLSGSDTLLSVATVNSVTNTFQISTTNLLANTAVPHVTVGNNALSTANLVIRTGMTVPANSGSNGVQGQIIYDSGFVYVCIANNSWKRAAIAAF